MLQWQQRLAWQHFADESSLCDDSQQRYQLISGTRASALLLTARGACDSLSACLCVCVCVCDCVARS
jgi:hypothetical protein